MRDGIKNNTKGEIDNSFSLGLSLFYIATLIKKIVDPKEDALHPFKY